MSGYGYLDGHRSAGSAAVAFLVFALAVIVSVGGLTARLFYLQVVNGGQFAALSEGNRTALEAIPSSRGLIYDRAGNVLVTNVPTFAVKIRPADLPEDRRDEVVNRLSALTGVAAVDINKAIDGNPGSRFDAVRVAQDVPKETASLIAEASFELPGVEVAVEAAPPVHRRAAVLADPRLHGPGVRGADHELEGQTATCRTTSSARPASRRTTRATCAARTASSGSSATPPAATSRSSRPCSDSQAGDSLKLTIDTREQKLAQQALQWAHEGGRPQARRDHRHEPPDRRDPARWSACRRTTTTSSPAGSARRTTARCSRTPTSRSSTTRSRPTTHPAPPTSS